MVQKGSILNNHIGLIIHEFAKLAKANSQNNHCMHAHI